MVDRDHELAVLIESLSAAEAGNGSTLFVEGPAGQGKSRLLAVAGDMARERRMQVLGAVGSELEREFPFGVAIQLFEPRWISASQDERTAMLSGPAHLVRVLLEHGTPNAAGSASDPAYPLIHGLFRLARNVATSPTEPCSAPALVILADDINWADPPSLRFLTYLSERIANLPIVLILTQRTGTRAGDQDAVDALRAAQGTTNLRLRPLGRTWVKQLVLTQFPEAERAFITACIRATSGNPFLLSEVLEQIHAEGFAADSITAGKLGDLVPESIVSAVVARLQGMTPAAQAVSRAVSVLGDGASLRHSARLAELDFATASHAADELASNHVLHPGQPLSFVHPVVRSAVAASMPRLARGVAHRRAAEIVSADSTAPEAAVAHLLCAPPQGDPWAVDILRSAAQRALGSGAAASAVRLLERALAEPPASEDRKAIAAELAEAEMAAGVPHAAERLAQVIATTEDPQRRVALIFAQGTGLQRSGHHERAAAAFRAALDQTDVEDPVLLSEVEAAYVASASLVPALVDGAEVRRQNFMSQLHGPPTGGQRVALAHVALQDSLIGDSRFSVRQLADLAWGNGALLTVAGIDSPVFPLLTSALTFVDELERAIEICEVALGDARERGSNPDSATVSYCRSLALYEQGRIAEATADAHAALDARDDEHTHLRTAYGVLTCCHIQTGNLEAAAKTLGRLGDPETQEGGRYANLLDIRARFHLAQHRPQEALNDATLAGRCLRSSMAVSSPGAIAWRSTAALAHLALGHAAEATELATEELDMARRMSITRVVIRDLRVLGLAAGGDKGMELLQEAVRAGNGHPQRLEQMSALIDLGGALRRANQRAAARGPLRAALELAHSGGATALAARAQTELAASGARPRRAMLSGIDSLTPSQRRVAEVAAQGLTNRQIAESLFVTPKTVEFHLRLVYQKLDISSRDQLTQALRGEYTA